MAKAEGKDDRHTGESKPAEAETATAVAEPKPSRLRMGDLLVNRGVVTRAQLEE